MEGPVAVTGGTGFIGRRVVATLREGGWPVRALVRRSAPELEQDGIVTVPGSLEDRESIERLVAGTVAVVHCAGTIHASRSDAFDRVNALGTARLVEVVKARARRPRCILLSSLAARAPSLSPYAASKHRGEQEAISRAAGGVDLCIVRPPAVYGPGDRATLPVFRQLERGLLLVPAVADARFSLIYVEDLVELIRRLLDLSEWAGIVSEPDDGREGGYSWSDLVAIAARELGRRVRAVAAPRPVFWVAAGIAQMVDGVFGRPPRLSLGKVAELFHPDWVCRPSTLPGLTGTWTRTTFEDGFPLTRGWYKRNQWL